MPGVEPPEARSIAAAESPPGTAVRHSPSGQAHVATPGRPQPSDSRSINVNELRSERDLLSAVFDTTSALVIVFDPLGRIVRFNRACEQTTGYRFDEVQGRCLWDVLLVQEEKEEAERIFKQVLADRIPNHHQCHWLTRQGDQRLFAWWNTAVVGADGRVDYIIGTGTDITERQRAEEAVKLEGMRLNSLLELSQTASDLSEGEIIQHTLEEVVRLTHSQIGYLHFVNPNQETIQLYTWSEEALKHCTAVHDSHYPISQAGVWADSARSKLPVVHNDYQGLSYKRGYPKGHSHLVRHASIPVVDGDKVTLVLGVGNKDRDYDDTDTRQMVLAASSLWRILQRKRVEEELHRHVRALEEADRHKDEFLAMLAHELRNPLAPMSTALYVFDRPGATPELVQQAQRVIGRQVKHLTRLVDDLLDVSRITRGKIELRCEEVDVAEIVRNAIELNRDLIDTRRQQLTTSISGTSLTVEGDPVRLTQLMGNLLNNAAKYTPECGTISIILGRDGGAAEIRVRDSGVGISADMLPRVFDLFAQADQSLDRSSGGLGLGLTLVQKLVQMHDGTVDVYSAGLNRGSEFVVRLPLVSGHAVERTQQAPAESTASTGRRILVVDDNRDTASMLTSLLEISGHAVTVAHDGASALKVAKEAKPEVVLLDIGLPGMDGYEVARRLRECVQGRPMLLIALTGYAHKEAVQQSHDAGFDHHLIKPLDPERLADLLSKRP